MSRERDPVKFSTPHSIATDLQGHVYVADRGNRRIQVFDGDGRFLRQMTIDIPAPPDARPAIGNMPTATTGAMAPGAPWAICITPGPKQVLYVSDAFPGRIYKLTLDGKVLGMLGKSGKQPQAVRVDPRDRLPDREHAVCRRAAQLAGAEAPARLTVD